MDNIFNNNNSKLSDQLLIRFIMWQPQCKTYVFWKSDTFYLHSEMQWATVDLKGTYWQLNITWLFIVTKYIYFVLIH